MFLFRLLLHAAISTFAWLFWRYHCSVTSDTLVQFIRETGEVFERNRGSIKLDQTHWVSYIVFFNGNLDWHGNYSGKSTDNELNLDC